MLGYHQPPTLIQGRGETSLTGQFGKGTQAYTAPPPPLWKPVAVGSTHSAGDPQSCLNTGVNQPNSGEQSRQGLWAQTPRPHSQCQGPPRPPHLLLNSGFSLITLFLFSSQNPVSLSDLPQYHITQTILKHKINELTAVGNFSDGLQDWKECFLGSKWRFQPWVVLHLLSWLHRG